MMLSPKELKELDQRFGEQADKIISRVTRTLFNYSESEAGRKPAFFHNCVSPEMSEVLYSDEDKWPLWVDDIVSGVARLDWYGPRDKQVPLSKKKIVQCFALLELVNTSTISHLLRVEKRQAQRYFKACELLHQRLIDGYCDYRVHSLHYPEVFIYPQTDLKEEIQ